MEPNMNNTNNDNSRVRPVRAPGFANGEDGLSAGGASVGMQNDGGSGVAFEDKSKKSHGMLYGMILLAILAAGGIGFGVWAFLDGNSRVAKKDGQISDLNSQISSLQQEKSELSDKVAELTQTNEQAQADISADEEEIREDEVIIAEDQQREAEGYQVKSIDACILDTGTVGGGSIILKCDATTSLGNGKFVYDSQSNKLRFVILQ